MENVENLKETLFLANRLLILEGLTQLGRGHVAVRIPGQDAMMIPGHLHDLARALDHITRKDMVTIDFDGKVLDGYHQESMGEFHMYSAVFRRRRDVNACLHAHPFYAAVIMAAKASLLPVSRDACLFLDGVPHFEKFPLYVGDRPLGEAMAETLGNKKAVFHRGHGVLVVGKNIKETLVRMVLLESACKIQAQAAAMGPLVPFKAEEISERHKDLSDESMNDIFDYLCTKYGL